MLILDRRHGQSVTLEVGDVEIQVHVIHSRTSSVKLGFDAPRNVRIRRNELPGDAVLPVDEDYRSTETG